MRTFHFFLNNLRRTFLAFLALSSLALPALAQPGRPMDPADKAKLEALKKRNQDIMKPGALQRAPGKVTSEWSIIIVSYRGEGAQPAAEAAAEKVRTKGNLPEAYAEQRGEAWVVAYGHYPSFDDAPARRDLEHIKSITIDDGKPFDGAVLSPPLVDHIAGTLPQYDLANVKSKQGKRAAYSLQVGVYDAGGQGRQASPDDIKSAREAAEKATLELRREGEEAYYYHGPRRSMVTIGVFPLADLGTTKGGTPVLSPRIKEVRNRFPYNLVNGQGLLIRNEGEKEGRLQPSFLVAIP